MFDMSNKAEMPKPPTRPTPKTFRTLAKKLETKIPYILDGNDEIPWSEDNFTVLLAPLKARHHLDYERTYGVSLDQTVGQILSVVSMQNRYLSNMDRITYTDDEGKPVTETDESYVARLESIKPAQDEYGNYLTPFGKMVNSVDFNILQLVSYILSVHGRVVGKDAHGFVLEPVSQDEVLEYLDKSALTVTDEEGTPFDEILSVSGLYNTELMKEELVENKELTDDDLKNSASKTVEESSESE